MQFCMLLIDANTYNKYNRYNRCNIQQRAVPISPASSLTVPATD